ncbi:hypothetical protein FWF48_02045 [Candidatus Saccharibacteria bacterium]|nr:hypothetical protein [Candidatus Saccharibacteria bacterium]
MSEIPKNSSETEQTPTDNKNKLPDPDDVGQERLDRELKARGLPEDASWSDVVDYDNQPDEGKEQDPEPTRPHYEATYNPKIDKEDSRSQLQKESARFEKFTGTAGDYIDRFASKKSESKDEQAEELAAREAERDHYLDILKKADSSDLEQLGFSDFSEVEKLNGVEAYNILGEYRKLEAAKQEPANVAKVLEQQVADQAAEMDVKVQDLTSRADVEMVRAHIQQLHDDALETALNTAPFNNHNPKRYAKVWRERYQMMLDTLDQVSGDNVLEQLDTLKDKYSETMQDEHRQYEKLNHGVFGRLRARSHRKKMTEAGSRYGIIVHLIDEINSSIT